MAAPTREQVIEGLARELEELGYGVAARGGLGGRDEPVPVNGVIPDLLARWVDIVLLLVFENPESLYCESSERTWRALGSSYFSFEVVCPGTVLGEARLLARARGVRVHRFWVF